MKRVDIERYHFLEIEPGDYSMDFFLKESIGENGKDAERVRLSGFLKWDGCINWSTGSTENSVMYHFCDIEDAELLHQAFQKIWDLGPENIKHWLDG